MIEQLAQFVRSHGHPCRIEGNHLKIAITGVVVQSPKTHKIGRAYWEIVRVPANLDDVRDELEY